MGDAIAYIDAMNLYHGIRAKYGRKYLWLDLYALTARLRQPDTIIKVWYFTTIVAGEPDAARRQETYLAALTTLPAADRNRARQVQGQNIPVFYLWLPISLCLRSAPRVSHL